MLSACADVKQLEAEWPEWQNKKWAGRLWVSVVKLKNEKIRVEICFKIKLCLPKIKKNI